MIEKLIYPCSDSSFELYCDWSEKLRTRTQRANVRPQMPLNYEFAPGINMYDPEFVFLKTQLYKALTRYSNSKGKEVDLSLCEAPTNDDELIPSDWSFVLNGPGTKGHPSGYMQGAQDCDFNDADLFQRYETYVHNLGLRFSLENYSGLIKPSSSSGLPYFSTDLPLKLAETLRINRAWCNLSSKILAIKNVKEYHLALVNNGLALVFMMNSRLQPDNFSKLRWERTIWNELVYSDRGMYYDNPSTATYFKHLEQTLGDKFIKSWFLKERGDYYKAVESDKVYFSMMRLRSPYMGSHINITDSAISPSIQNGLIEDYEHIFHVSDRLTLEKRVNDLQDKWGNVYMVALDYRHFEMCWPDKMQRINCKAIDQVLPEPYNTYYERYMHSNVLMFSRTKRDFEISKLFISKDYYTGEGCIISPYDPDPRYPLKTEGNLSGHAYVSLWNKLLGSFVVIEILRRALPQNKLVGNDLSDYTLDNDIQFINNGDDNLLFFKRREDAMNVFKWIENEKKIFTIELTTDLPSFNAMYLVKQKNGYYSVRPSMTNYIARWVAPEYDYGLIKKGRAEYPNLGKHLRMQAFLAYDFHSQVNELFHSIFYDIYHRNVLDCFQLDEIEEQILLQQYSEPDSSQSVWNFFAATDIDRFLWDPRAKDAPLSELQKYFFVITPDEFYKFITGEMR